MAPAEDSCFFFLNIAYHYKGTRPGNCIIIQPNCTASQAQISIGDRNSVAFEKGLLIQTEIYSLFSKMELILFC